MVGSRISDEKWEELSMDDFCITRKGEAVQNLGTDE